MILGTAEVVNTLKTDFKVRDWMRGKQGGRE